MSEFKVTGALRVVSAAMCAALYALGCYLTAYIVSPWGRGQFRPAVVIPQVIAVIFGGMPAGLGAAIGTFIADSIKHHCPYVPSLIAAVPSNFIAFYIYGKLLHEKFSLKRFILTTYLTLIIGNALCAFLYVPTIYFLGALPPNLTWLELTSFAVALTVWWFVTMLPFSLIVTPAILKSIAQAFPSITPMQLRSVNFGREFRSRAFNLTMMISGSGLAVIGLFLAYTPLGNQLLYAFTIKLHQEYALLTIQFINSILMTFGFAMTILGAALSLLNRSLMR